MKELGGGVKLRGVLKTEFGGDWRGVLCTVPVLEDTQGEVRDDDLDTDLPFIADV